MNQQNIHLKSIANLSACAVRENCITTEKHVATSSLKYCLGWFISRDFLFCCEIYDEINYTLKMRNKMGQNVADCLLRCDGN